MKKKLFGFMKTDRRGLALISVLGVVTLATILVLALFTVSDAEKRSAESYAEGNAARHLANSAIDIVKNQIQAAATGSTVPGTGPVIWASQPGAVRTYDQEGRFAQGRTLFSSSSMVTMLPGVSGEGAFTDGVGVNHIGRFDAQWDQKPDQWVDLNLPVVRVRPAGGGATGAAAEVIFPVMDPRPASTRRPFPPVEGFNYVALLDQDEVNFGGTVPGVVTDAQAGGSPDNMRCPMPVEWLYVLRDGTVGTVTSGGGAGSSQWNSGGRSTPSANNPIVGRVAFWTDDESTKINLNTAGEPSPWMSPTAYHARDVGYANNQPVVAEYQRYPGHPATVATSVVLNPNFSWDTYIAPATSGGLPTRSQADILYKEGLYGFLPRLGPGGTVDGTKVYGIDDFQSNTAANVDWLQMQSERLFVSVDEAVFSGGFSTVTGRQPQPPLNSGAGNNVLAPSRINESKFFLTAASSAPETNMFGLPRVAIWPVPDGALGNLYRTGFDSAVELATTLGPQESDNVYAFRRRDSRSHAIDMGLGASPNSPIARNAKLMNYLDQLINTSMPGGGSFFTKYAATSSSHIGANDARQILVQIFDYIRCTNLFDSYLSERTIANNGIDYRDSNGGKPVTDIAVHNDTPAFGQFYTYTEPRFQVTRRGGDVNGLPEQARLRYQEELVMTGAYPGHGQVRPIEWSKGGFTYKGLGRFPTISEVALQFICTADGRINNHSFSVPAGSKPSNALPGMVQGRIYSGGRVAQKLDTRLLNKRLAITNGAVWERWYSNIPPFPSRATFENQWGMLFGIDPNLPLAANRHPGWNARNWNVTLDRDTPLKVTEKRIQAAILVEMFVPAAGWTKYVPDWTLVIDGNSASGIRVNGKAIFQTTGPQVLQSTSAYVGGSYRGMSQGDNVYPLGGSYGTGALLNGRRVKAIGEMPRDPGYNDAAGSSVHGAMQNFPLVSNFFTVDVGNQVAQQRIQFTGTPLKMELYASHDWQGAGGDQRGTVPVQTFEINFPGDSVPPPDLVVHSTEKREWIDESGNSFLQEAVPAVRWWSFSYGGAVNRYKGQGNIGSNNPWGANIQELTENEDGGFGRPEHRTWGRFRGEPRTAVESRKGQAYPYGDSATETRTVVNSQGDQVRVVRSGNVVCGGIIYGFSTGGNFSGTKAWPAYDNPGSARNPNGGFGPNGGKENGQFLMGNYSWFGSDSIRSMVPRHGDYRVIAAMKNVPASVWQQHPVWVNTPNALFAHSITSFSSNSQVGMDFGDINDPNIPVATNRLVQGAWYNLGQVPDTPLISTAAASAQKHGDFDNGTGLLRDGAYINKPDDGNMSLMGVWHGGSVNPNTYRLRNAYFTDSWLQVPSAGGFFSPNRLVPSPGVFGSLPTGVFGSKSTGADQAHATLAGVGWRTLLFRADTTVASAANGSGHQGGSGFGPADHLWMDLFWMPIVDPRPESYAMATEGKINMNYQILPFRHITRATGMHGALKGEFITAYGNTDVRPTSGLPVGPNNTLIYKTAQNTSVFPHRGWSEADGMNWHRRIDIEKTLWQFEDRFKAGSSVSGIQSGLFRTASQICEIHLIPSNNGTSDFSGIVNVDQRQGNYQNAMSNFYASRRITGDNTRERTYANIYQKLTTKSNAFRIFFKAQTIKKAKSLSPTEVDTGKDSVTAEYQGSALIQRFLDLTVDNLPDYAEIANPVTRANSLEHKYRYRVLEMKQFAP